MYNTRILVVEDDIRISEIVQKYLINAGFEVSVSATGAKAMEQLSLEEYHLILLDIMLPDTDGWTLIRQIKKIKDIPVIMLTARSEEEDKLFGFELGADDYITKPFSMKLLLARINVALKRSQVSAVNTKIDMNGIVILKASREVQVVGEVIVLTPIEYSLLLYFVDNLGIALSRDQILNGVWGYDYYGDSRTVDTHVKRLRQKLGPVSECITTVRGHGYRMVNHEK